MKGKKGAWMFDVFFVLVLMMVLSYVFIVVYGMTDRSDEFGDLQGKILNTYHKGEEILFYVDYTAKYSIYQSMYNLGQKGGFYGKSCENYLGYSIWKDGCYPDRIILKNNFNLHLSDIFNNYLMQYPDKETTLHPNNYDFLIKEDKIVGIATKNVEFDIKEKQDSDSLGKYSIKPSFNQKTNFDIFEDYSIIVPKAKQLENTCKPSQDIETCVNDNKNILNTNNLILSDNCESEIKKIFSDFAENVYLCANSADDNCICKFNTLEGDYDLFYLEENNVKMFEDDEILFGLDFNVNYDGNDEFDEDEEVILLKKNNKLKKYDEENLPFCTIKRKAFRFCIESNKEVYAYSEEEQQEDKQTRLRNVQYRFALKLS